MANSPDDNTLPAVLKKLKKTLVNPRNDMLKGYRQIQREHAAMKAAIVNFRNRIKRIEDALGIGNSPSGNSP